MPVKRLTDLTLARAAPPKGGRLDLPDHQVPGLACRVTPDGTKTFALRYRIGGRQPRLTIGRFPLIGLAEARRRAREALALVDRGIDPAAAKAEARREQERDTAAAVASEYVERYLKRNTKRWRDAEQILRREVLPRWGARPVASITRRDVLDLVDGVADRGARVAANRLLSLIKRWLNWAVERGILETNVATRIRPPHKETPRERSLSEAEIKAAWQAFEAMGHPFGTLDKLLLLTAQRRGEIAGLRWPDVDLEAGVLHLAGAATKTGVEHVLPLSRAAIEILRAVPRGDSPLVFPADRPGSVTPISGFTRALATVHRLSGTTGWHRHDLRRSAATHMAQLGIAPHVCERILNHSGGSTMSVIARTYNRHSYQAEMRAALELWAAEIDRIVTGRAAEVVPLRARR